MEVKREGSGRSVEGVRGVVHRLFRPLHSIRVRLLAGYLAVLLLLSLAWLVSNASNGQIIAHYAHTVDGDDALLQRVTLQLRLMDDQETGLRGYELTGRPLFLQPYQRAERQLPAVIRSEVLLAPNETEPEVQRNLEALRKRAEAWQRWARQQLHHLDLSIAAQLRGKALFDRMRAAATRATEAIKEDRQDDLGRSRLAMLHANMSLAAAFLAALWMLALASYLCTRLVSRPLYQLRVAAERIGAGNLQEPVRVRGGVCCPGADHGCYAPRPAPGRIGATRSGRPPECNRADSGRDRARRS